MIRVGVVGATGAVGREVVRILEERAFPLDDLRLFATRRSAGKTLAFRGVPVVVQEISEDGLRGLDLVLCDTPDPAALEWVPRAARAGALVVDNSGAFRAEPDVPLVIPEVNPAALRAIPRGIVANPNCTVATFIVPLAPLHRAAGLVRATVCSYQSVSGAGQAGVEQLWQELRAVASSGQPLDQPLGRAFAHPIALNVIPAIGRASDGATPGEEAKVAAEARRLLDLPDLHLGATCVRVPTLVGHGVAVHAEFSRPIAPDDARAILASSPGVEVVDDLEAERYPTSRLAAGHDACYVGRIRTDGAGALAFFAAADNLRKGAALNAVQIAEALLPRLGAAPSARAGQP